jgi:hypothetical protein
VSAARARRRLMAWERYRRRALLLNADGKRWHHRLVGHAHHRAWARVDRNLTAGGWWRWRRWPWQLHDPYRPPP